MVGLGIAGTIVRLALKNPFLIQYGARLVLDRFRVASELRRDDGFSQRPLGLTLKPVFSCNLHCSMCTYAQSGAVASSPRESLALDIWQRLVDDVAPWRPYVWLTGGEPTLYPAIIPLIFHIKARRLLCGMTTNGTTLEALAQQIVEAGLDILVVSFDGVGEVNNRVRGRPWSFDRAYRGVEAVNDAKKSRSAELPLVVINCSFSEEGYYRAHEVRGLAGELGVSALHVQHLWMLTQEMITAHNARWGHEHYLDSREWSGPNGHGIDPVRAASELERLKSGRNGLPVIIEPSMDPKEIEVYYRSPETFVGAHHALCAWLGTDILPNGDVSPCFGLVCGNITAQRFTQIWNNEAFRAHRRRLALEGRFPICARCCAYWRKV